MFDVFGAEMPLAVRFFLAFLIVLGLIGVTAWAVRRFGSGQLGGTVRGRQPRLAVIDYANVDARRRLILVRRDNVEHLLMIGGPSDIVVEPSIVRATPAARDVALARPPSAPEPLPRVVPLPEAASNGSWPLQPEPLGPSAPPAPPPMPPRRAPRVETPRVEPQQLEPALPEEEPRIPSAPPPIAEPPARPQREPLTALAEDLAAHPASPPPPPLPRSRAGGPPRPQPVQPRPEMRPEPRAEPRIELRPEPRLPETPAEAEAAAAPKKKPARKPAAKKASAEGEHNKK